MTQPANSNHSYQWDPSVHDPPPVTLTRSASRSTNHAEEDEVLWDDYPPNLARTHTLRNPNAMNSGANLPPVGNNGPWMASNSNGGQFLNVGHSHSAAAAVSNQPWLPPSSHRHATDNERYQSPSDHSEGIWATYPAGHLHQSPHITQLNAYYEHNSRPGQFPRGPSFRSPSHVTTSSQATSDFEPFTGSNLMSSQSSLSSARRGSPFVSSDTSEGTSQSPTNLAVKVVAGSKIPHVDWQDELEPCLTDELLDLIMVDAGLRRILFPILADKRATRPAKFGHTILAKKLFEGHKYHGKYYLVAPASYEEAVRSKLKYLKKKYTECRAKLNATGSGLQEDDYHEGNHNLWGKIREHLRQYDIMHELMGERAAIGEGAVNSQSSVEASAARIPKSSSAGPKKKDKNASGDSDSEQSGAGGQHVDPDDGNDVLEDGDSDTGEVEIIGATSSGKGVCKDPKGAKRGSKGPASLKDTVEGDFRTSQAQAARLDPLGKAIQESAKLQTERKALKDERLLNLQEKAQSFAEKVAERKLKIKEDRLQMAKETEEKQYELRKQELAMETAKIQLENHRLEVEADRIKLEAAQIQLKLVEAECTRAPQQPGL